MARNRKSRYSESTEERSGRQAGKPGKREWMVWKGHLQLALGYNLVCKRKSQVVGKHIPIPLSLPFAPRFLPCFCGVSTSGPDCASLMPIPTFMLPSKELCLDRDVGQTYLPNPADK